MKKPVSSRLIFVSSLMILATLLAACTPGAAVPVTGSGSPTTASKPLKVAMLFSEPITGSAFDQDAYQGLQTIHSQLGAQIAYTASVQSADIQNTLSTYASQGYNLIIGNGFEYGDPELAVAKNNPNTDFVAITGDVSAPNVSSVDFAQGESGYVLGVLAGLMTKTNKIGVVAGFSYASIIRFTEGIKLGVKSVNPNAKVTVVFINSFTDASKGQQAARALVAQGCDILMHKADAVGQAVIQVAQQNHIYAIGDGPNQEALAPNTVLTSDMASTPELLLQVAKTVQAGTFKGTNTTPGFAAGVLSIAPFSSAVPADVQAKVNQVIANIKSGSLKVPEITTQSS
jgi:basic membrane protein A and related proteins